MKKTFLQGLGLGIAVMALSRAVQRLLTASILDTGFDPLLAAALSLIFAGILLAPLLFLSGPVPSSRKFWLFAAGIAIVNVFFPAVGFTLGQQGISATISGMFVALVPVAVAAFAAFFLKEKLTWRGWGGLFAATFCVFCLALGREGGAEASVWGVLFSSAAVLSAAWSYVLIRKTRVQFNVLQLVAAQGMISALVSLPLIFLTNTSSLFITPLSSWILLLALGAASIIIPQIAMVAMLREAPAPKVAVANYITPALTALLALLFLGEAITLEVALAGTGAVLGAWIVNQDRFSAKEPKQILSGTTQKA